MTKHNLFNLNEWIDKKTAKQIKVVPAGNQHLGDKSTGVVL